MRQTRQAISGRPVPDGAPLKCKAGFHEPSGPEAIGTMGFTCCRCKGFYRHDRDYSHLATIGDAMIERGDAEAAVRLVEDTISRDYRS